MKKDVSITVGFRTLMPKPHEDMYYLIDLIMHHPDAEIGETWNATDENLEWLTEDVQSLADGIVDEIRRGIAALVGRGAEVAEVRRRVIFVPHAER